MKKLSKVLSIFLCFAMLIGFVPISTDASDTCSIPITYDFSGITQKGTKITDNATAYDTLKEADTEKSTHTHVHLTSVTADNVYLGNGNGGKFPSQGGLLKFGTGSADGTLTLTFAPGTNITSVDVYCYAWNENKEDTVAVNGGTPVTATNTGDACAVKSFSGSFSNTVSITSHYRIFISKIVINGTFSEPAGPVCDHSDENFQYDQVDKVGHKVTCKDCTVVVTPNEAHTYNSEDICENCSFAKPVIPGTAVTDIADGKYIIAFNDGTKNWAFTALTSSYGNLKGTEVTITSGEVVNPDASVVFTLTKDGDYYTIQDSGNNYLYMSGSYDNFNKKADKPASGHLWAIRKDGDNYIIVNVEKQKVISWMPSSSKYGSFAITKNECDNFTLTLAEPKYNCTHSSIVYGKNATQHWEVCKDCNFVFEETKTDHTAVGTPCTTCGLDQTIGHILTSGEADSYYRTSGVVIYIKSDKKNIYIQDANGDAICAYFSAAQEDVALGDSITVVGSYTVYRNLPELQYATIVNNTDSTLPEANVVTLSDLLGDNKADYVCTYVKINGLFVIVEGSKVYLAESLDEGAKRVEWNDRVIVGDAALKTGDKVDFVGGVNISDDNIRLGNTAPLEVTAHAPHDYTNSTYGHGSANHWLLCDICGRKDESSAAPHDSQWDTTTEPGKHIESCPTCGYVADAKDHEFSTDYVITDASHYQECECGEKQNAHDPAYTLHATEHKLVCSCGDVKDCTGTPVWTTGAQGHYLYCEACGYQTTPCNGELKWVSTDASQHWHACSVTGCGYTTEKKDHDHKTLVNKNDGTHVPTCECGHTEAAVAHNYEGRPYSKAANKQHYQTCACGQTSAFENCLDGDDADEKCDKCGQNLACDHTGTTPKHNETHHWDECTNPDCGEHLNEVEHTLSPQKDADYHWKGCTCGYEIDKAEHTLTAKSSDTHHWTACECGEKTAEVAHEFLTTKSNTTHHWTECSCGAKTANVAHEYTSKYNGTHHWTECACGVKTAEALHEFTANHNDTHHWTKCACGAKTTETAHTLTYEHDNAQHWQVCDCGYASAKADHTLTDNKCACGYEKSAAPEGSAGQVTNSSTLAVGDKVVIGTGEMVMSNVHDKGNYHLGIEGAAADGYVLIGDGMVIVTLEAGASEGTFALKTDAGYLCSAGEKNNYLKLSDTVDAASSWKIEILHTGEAVITNVDQPTRTIRWNAQSPRFATYRSGQTAVYLYEVGAVYTPGNAPADPAPSDPKEIVDAAFALGAGEDLPYSATLTGVITAVDEEGYSESFGNITVTISVEGTSGTKSLVVYRMVATTATKDLIAGLAVGDTITVSGNLCNYNGTIEFAASCTLDAVVKAQTPVDPVDPPVDPVDPPVDPVDPPVDPVDPPVDPVDPPVDPVDPPVEPEEPAGIADGTYVIFNPAHKITLSTTYNGFYNNGVEGVVQDSTLSGFTAAEVWTIKNNDDGTITISCANGVLSQSTYSSMGMDLENNTWVLESAGNGQYYVKNVGTGKYMEWYAEKNNWSTYYIDDDTDTSLFALQFCPVNADGTTAEIPKTGDTISVIFALMLVSLMGTAVILKKKQF